MNEDITRALRDFESLYRRVRSLEMKSEDGAMPRKPTRNPYPGYFWHDAENGKLKIWNGSGWDTFSRDV